MASLLEELREVIAHHFDVRNEQLRAYFVSTDARLDRLIEIIERFLHHPPPPPHPHHRKLVLQMPSYTTLTGEPLMANNFQLPTNKIATFGLTETNTTTGALDPIPAGDTFTAVSADTVNLNATINPTGSASGGPALVANWLHTTSPMLTGVAVTVSDSAGNLTDTQLFDMVAPAAVPDQIGLDVSGVVLTDQPTAV